MKIWSPPEYENLTTGKKYFGKEEKLLLRCNFSSFPQYFQYISNFKSPITHILVKCSCSNIFFLNSVTLICRGTDISKYFRESLGIRDNESRLYFRQVPWVSMSQIFLLELHRPIVFSAKNLSLTIRETRKVAYKTRVHPNLKYAVLV